MVREFDKIGEKYSKLSPKGRKEKIKEINNKLKPIKLKNEKLQKERDKLDEEIHNGEQYRLEKHLDLLTHCYKPGDWVVIEEGMDYGNGRVSRKFKLVKIRKKVANKNYIVEDHDVGLKECFTMPKIYESRILCHIKNIHSMEEVKFWDKSYRGKVKNIKLKYTKDNVSLGENK